MIDRLQFIQWTFALAYWAKERHAVAQNVAPTPAPLDDASHELIWHPCDDAVASWLAWYKDWVKGTFPDIEILFPVRLETYRLADRSTYQDLTFVDEDPREMIKNLEDFESALATLEITRFDVGCHQGLGYEAGRAGKPRECRDYTFPSNAGFAWYNGWAQGHLDYLRLIRKAPEPARGDDVFFPEGDPRRHPRKPLVLLEHG